MKEYVLASVWKRIFAFLIDYFIFFLLVIFFSYLFGETNEEIIKFSVSGFPAFILFLLGIYLWIVSEALYGQTFGKQLMKIKVVNSFGREIKTSQAILRFIFAFIDLLFLIGLIVAIFNKKNQRIGDIIAETIVVDL